MIREEKVTPRGGLVATAGGVREPECFRCMGVKTRSNANVFFCVRMFWAWGKCRPGGGGRGEAIVENLRTVVTASGAIAIMRGCIYWGRGFIPRLTVGQPSLHPDMTAKTIPHYSRKLFPQNSGTVCQGVMPLVALHGRYGDTTPYIKLGCF